MGSSVFIMKIIGSAVVVLLCVDGLEGSCGCGDRNSDTPHNWNLQELVTAPSQRFFDDGGTSTWCGRNCGACVKLTPTGGWVPGSGRAPNNHNPQIFMVTNDCPAVDPNMEWCNQWAKPGTGAVNTHAYEVHFDLQNHYGQINNLGWDNPEVTWEHVSCPQHFRDRYRECFCSGHH